MKVLAMALGLLFMSAAYADEILLFDLSPSTFQDPISYRHGVEGAFAVNKEMGRAWVEVTVVEDANYSGSRRHNYRTKVEGLTYDPTSSMVVLESEGRLVECATVKAGGRIFRGDRIYPTGNCKFIRRYVKVPYDDGYRTGTKTRLHVYLDVK